MGGICAQLRPCSWGLPDLVVISMGNDHIIIGVEAKISPLFFCCLSGGKILEERVVVKGGNLVQISCIFP